MVAELTLHDVKDRILLTTGFVDPLRMIHDVS